MGTAGAKEPRTPAPPTASRRGDFWVDYNIFCAWRSFTMAVAISDKSSAQSTATFKRRCCIERSTHSNCSHLPRPNAPQQGSDARFVMVLHGDCEACFAALSRGEDTF